MDPFTVAVSTKTLFLFVYPMCSGWLRGCENRCVAFENKSELNLFLKDLKLDGQVIELQKFKLNDVVYTPTLKEK